MSKKLRDLGEDGFLALLRPILKRHTEGLVLGTGDDVAITQPRQPSRLAWTIDAMIEHTHFSFRGHDREAEWLGRKLAVSNLSDLASKGATPLYGLLSFGAPLDADQKQIENFYRGLEQELSAAGCKLIGGDTVKAPEWSLALALIGELTEDAVVAARSRAKPGQNVFVTGTPGCSSAGFEALEKGDGDSWPGLVKAHCCPTARLREGAALVREFGDLAMLDVSDGVARDARRIADLSNVQLVLEENGFIYSEDLKSYARQAGCNARHYFLSGGEDYELLFCTAATEEQVRKVLVRAGIQTPVARIGRVEEGAGLSIAYINGRTELFTVKGFEHFS